MGTCAMDAHFAMQKRKNVRVSLRSGAHYAGDAVCGRHQRQLISPLLGNTDQSTYKTDYDEKEEQHHQPSGAQDKGGQQASVPYKYEEPKALVQQGSILTSGTMKKEGEEKKEHPSRV